MYHRNYFTPAILVIAIMILGIFYSLSTLPQNVASIISTNVNLFSSILSIAQTIGIIGTLYFVIIQYGNDRKERQYNTIKDIISEHREIWSKLYDDPTLSRIEDSKVDLITKPVSDSENRFMSMVINHMNLMFEASELKLYQFSDGDKRDIKELLLLPIPKKVWDEFKNYQKKEFAVFIDSLLMKEK